MVRFAPIDVDQMSKDDRTRFAAMYAVTESGCWAWGSMGLPGTYGRFKVRGKVFGAHRVSFALSTNADIPDGMVIDHLCRNPACVNPAHLEAVSYAENTARGESVNAAAVRSVIDTGKCIRGHDMSVTRVTRPSGMKSCAECDREASAERRARLAGDPAHREAERLRAIDYRERKAAPLNASTK